MLPDGSVVDWDALIGWGLTAGVLLAVVAVAWYRRYRRAPATFVDQLGRTTPGTTFTGAPTHPRPGPRG